jgi:hypothetical protein
MIGSQNCKLQIYDEELTQGIGPDGLIVITQTAKRLPYNIWEQIDGAQRMYGAIFGADVDLTHPLASGYNEKVISLFKANKIFVEKNKDPYAFPFYYGSNPLQSGWVSREKENAIKN